MNFSKVMVMVCVLEHKSGNISEMPKSAFCGELQVGLVLALALVFGLGLGLV